MSAFKTQTLPQYSTQQVIVNHIPIQAATELTGYNAQYLRRLLRVGKLEGIKVGQVWLVELTALQAYFSSAISSNDMRYGPKGAWQPPF